MLQLIALIVCVVAVVVRECGAAATCAIPSGTTNLQSAILKCCSSTSTRPLTVTLSSDVTTSPVLLSDTSCNSVTLDLKGYTIYAPDRSKWPSSLPTAFIEVSGLTGFTITNGKIEGKGSQWWTDLCKSSARPMLLRNYKTTKMTWSYLKITNSPRFHLVPASSTNTYIDHFTIDTPYTSSSCNLDGIDPSGSDGVFISNADIHTGDDCVAIKPGSNNIVVTNSVFRAGHGASIGSVPNKYVTNVVFKNIQFVPRSAGSLDNGARIKTWEKGVAFVYNITFDTFTLSGTEHPIIIDATYTDGDKSTPSHSSDGVADIKAQVPSSMTSLVTTVVNKIKAQGISSSFNSVLIDTINFKNFKISSTPSGKAPSIACLSNSPCTNLLIDTVTSDSAITCSNAYGKKAGTLPSSFSSCLKTAPKGAIGEESTLVSSTSSLSGPMSGPGLIAVIVGSVLGIFGLLVLIAAIVYSPRRTEIV